MKIQLLKSIEQSTCFEKNIITSSFNEYNDFNESCLNIIDLRGEYLWSWNQYGQIKLSSGLESNIESIKDSIKRKKQETLVLIILPRNITRGNKDLKNTIDLTLLINKINPADRSKSGKHEFPTLIYGESNTEIDGKEIKSSFTFDENDFAGFEMESRFSTNKTFWFPITKTVGEGVSTVKNGENIILTTLDIENDYLLNSFLKEINILENEKDDLPDWFFNLPDMFKETDIKASIEGNLKIISEKEQDNSKMKMKIDLYNYYKSILYESGEKLVEVVSEILNDMLPSDINSFIDQYDADFVFEYNDKYYVGEVKGISRNVGKSNVLQAKSHQEAEIEKEDEVITKDNSKSILIINPMRQLAPHEREQINEPIESIAKQNELLIITTEQLLKLYECFLNGGTSSSEIECILWGQTGVYNF